MISEAFQLFVNSDVVEHSHGVDFFAIGAAEEMGEIMGIVKRVMRGDRGYTYSGRKEDFLKEIGDVFWYLTALCQKLGYTLEEVYGANYNKLTERDKKGTRLGKGSNR